MDIFTDKEDSIWLKLLLLSGVRRGLREHLFIYVEADYHIDLLHRIIFFLITNNNNSETDYPSAKSHHGK